MRRAITGISDSVMQVLRHCFVGERQRAGGGDTVTSMELIESDDGRMQIAMTAEEAAEWEAFRALPADEQARLWAAYEAAKDEGHP